MAMTILHNTSAWHALIARMAADTPVSPDKKPDHLKLVTGDKAPEDIFNDMEKLRKVVEHKVQKHPVILNMTVGKPPDNAFFQCHPDPAQHIDTSLLYDKEERDVYYIGPDMMNHPLVVPRLRRVTIATTCLWPSGRIMLYPVPFPTGKRAPKCWKTARRAFRIASGQADLSELPEGFTPGKRYWVSLAWNEETQDYDLNIAEGIETPPQWPADLRLSNSLKLGFRDKTIVDEEHPHMRQLRGLTD
jgi:hypothetical protein